MPESHGEHPESELSDDELVEGLLHGHHQIPDVIVLRGFLGDSPTSGYHRLFTDPALRRWVDIRDDDIVYREHVQVEQGVYGSRSVLWIRRTATLLKGRLISAEEESRFLTGACGEEIPCAPPECHCPPHGGAPEGVLRGWSVNASRTGRGCC